MNEKKAIFDSQGIVLPRMHDTQDDRRMARVLFRLDERAYELDSTTNPAPNARWKTRLNDMVYGTQHT